MRGSECQGQPRNQKTAQPEDEFLRWEGTSKMTVRGKSWVGVAAAMGIVTVLNSTKPANAQQEMSVFAAPANFTLTTGIATDNTGAIYVANWHNTILKITHAGVVMTFAGKPDARGNSDGVGSTATFVYPIAIATDYAANVYVADKVSNTIRKITPTGIVTTFAGTAGVAGHADGAGKDASFSAPIGIATDGAGNIYVADSGNNVIRKITPDGAVTTVAGQAGERGEVDGTAKAARFSDPYSIAIDGAGDIFVAEMSRNTIRKITSDGVVTTLAGAADEKGHADGTGASATFHSPHGITADKAGNVYVADTGNNTIRKIAPTGVVTTIAGSESADENGEFDGMGTAATFSQPVAIATDSAGNLLVLEADNIREVTPSGEVTTVAGPVFGPWHLQHQFCEWDVPLDDSGAARSGTRRCALNIGTTYCSSSIEVTNANPKNTKPKLSLVYDGAVNVTAVDTKFKLERAEKDKGDPKDPKDDPPAGSWLHYVVTITVSSTSSCK
jgi:sugar lactone lactonase YvrE